MDTFILTLAIITGILAVISIIFGIIAIRKGLTPEKRSLILADLLTTAKTAINALEDGKISREEMQSILECVIAVFADITKQDPETVRAMIPGAEIEISSWHQEPEQQDITVIKGSE